MLSANFSNCEFPISTLTVVGLNLLCNCTGVRAQIIGDRLTNTQVKIEDNVSHILGGTKAGNNLFHSFEQFSVNTDTIANFENGLEVENIFSRVTGGNISQIDGLIQINGETNLFLINPAGIVFGANAQLNIGGSFVATTAEKVIFEDGMEFSAVATDSKPILTISSPVGLQYGAMSEISVLPNPNREASNSHIGLSVEPENTLALLGGDISIARNSLNAIGSNVEISSIKSGKVGLERVNGNWSFNYDLVREYGKIDLSQRAFINSSGVVNFKGETIDFSTSSGIRNFTDVGTKGTIRLEAKESITLDSSFLFTQVGETSFNVIERAIAGSGGDISIDAPKIFLTDGSVISAGTLSQGKGGNISLTSQSIELSSAIEGIPSIITTSTIGTGDGGQIEIDTGKLTIYDGSQIQAFAGEGKGGTITVNATESIDISGMGILRSQDNLGNIAETLLNSGFTASSGFENLPFELQPGGKSGSLIINTPQLAIADSAQISVSNYGSANAGDLKIATTALYLDTAGKIIANTASGKGGSIDIASEDLIVLDRTSTISTTAEQDGDGGNIFLETENLLLLDRNNIKADAQQGSGGNIFINTQGFFIEPNSKITASSQVTTKKGTIKIDTLDLNSRLHMGHEEYFPLVAQDNIYAGCGGQENFAQNSFQNVGKGGISHNPIKEIASSNVLTDFGKDESDNNVAPSDLSASAKQYKPKDPGNSHQSISEANSWKVNSKGNIELLARHNSSALMPYSACKVR